MASELISAFREEVGFYIKNAESASNITFIDKQIVRVIRDFCMETWIWRYVLTEIDVVDATPNYTLTLPTTDGAAELVMVDWVKFKEDGTDDDQYQYLDPVNLLTEELPSSTSKMSAASVEQSADAPIRFWVDPDDTLYINPIPNSTAAGTANLQVKVIVMPDFAATKVPDFIFDDWLEIIGAGVAGRICNMATQKWYDPKLADRYSRQYEEKKADEVRAQRWEGKNRKQMTVRPNIGFAGGSRSRNDWIF